MGMFDDFNAKINMDEVKKQMADAKTQNGTGDFKEVPPGNYHVNLVKMEVGKCKSGTNAGAPMLKVDFKIKGGEFNNYHLFWNKVLYTSDNTDTWNMGILMKSVCGWLLSLEPSEDINVTFENYNQFAEMVLDIAEDVSDLEYDVEYTVTEKNGYKFANYSIKEVYE